MKNYRRRLPGAVLALALAGTLSGCGDTGKTETTDNKATATGVAVADAPLAILSRDPNLTWGPCPPIFPAGCEITVLHGDPSRPNADVFLRVPVDYELPAHSHTSVERMVLVTGQLNVQYKGGAMTPLSVGQYAYGPAGLPHRGKCLGTEPCTLFIAFEGPVDGALYSGAFE